MRASGQPAAAAAAAPIALAMDVLAALEAIGFKDAHAAKRDLNKYSISDASITSILQIAGRHVKLATDAFPEQRKSYIASIMPYLKKRAKHLAGAPRTKKTEAEILEGLIAVAKVRGGRPPPPPRARRV